VLKCRACSSARLHLAQEAAFTLHFGYDAEPSERQVIYDCLRRALVEGNKQAAGRLVRQVAIAASK
jgi:hypothetical protein